jgi:acyl-CoA hydrolase
MHLSHVPQMVEFGFFGELDFAVVEAIDVTRDGRVYLSTSVGASPSFLRHAKKIIIELNRHPSKRLWEMHDIAILPPPPSRDPIPIHHPLSRSVRRSPPSTRTESSASSRPTSPMAFRRSRPPTRPARRSPSTSCAS